MKSAFIFRVIEECDIAANGNSLVTELLKQAGFDLDAPIERYYEPSNIDRAAGVWVFSQDVNWRHSQRFAAMRAFLKQSHPIHSKRAQGSIYAP